LGILTDILDRPRNLTRPDIGAFEIIPVLPITLAEFKGRKNGFYNLLSWITSNELNNTGFELERSINGIEFTKVTFIKTQAINGISSQKLFYSFEDASAPLNAKVYYRLKQIDKNGKYSYSNIVVLAGNKSDKFEITNLYPNPVSSILNLAISSTREETIKILITDIVGKVLVQENRFVVKGENSVTINTQKLSSGIYIVKALTANGVETISSKFVKN